MKGFKLRILILSILLLTISSGLLFYKNLFLIESPRTGSKVDFEELRYTDIQINATVTLLRKNLSADLTSLDVETDRLKELLNIVSDVNKTTPELTKSMVKIQSYFDRKTGDVTQFKNSLKILRKAVTELNPIYNELNKNNIKFAVDKKDFYRECVVDALFFVTTADKLSESQLEEDKKILSQILGFAKTPSPLIQKFSNNLEIITKETKQIDHLIEHLNSDQSINSELNLVGKFYKESQESKTRDGEIFLSMIFIAILLYLGSMVIILRKLN